MAIRPEERLFLAGKTRSGKTTLVRSVLNSQAGSKTPWVVLDPKHDYQPHNPSVPIVPEFRPDLPWQVVRVPVDAGESGAWDRAILGAWWRGDGILYVDEINLLNPSTRTVRVSLGNAIRTGGSRGLGVWSGTQRPKDIPSVYFTEAEHFCIFQLTYEPDRHKVTEFTHDGMAPALRAVKKHDFVYYSIFTERPILVHQSR